MSVLSYEELKTHLGHKVSLVVYGKEKEICLECEKCKEVLLSFTPQDFPIQENKENNMDTNDITEETFLKATIKQISQYYTGKRNCCRCGCEGEYTATTYMKNPRSPVNDKKVLKALKRAKELVVKGAEYDIGENYFDVKTGKNRSLTFYFDELK